MITVSSLGNILDFRAQYDFVVYGLGEGGIELLQLEKAFHEGEEDPSPERQSVHEER